jgi:hypothetical protein
MEFSARTEALEDAGLSYIIGARIPEEPYQVKQWRKDHPTEEIADGQVFTQPWPATPVQKENGRRDKVTYYRYKADSARRSLHGIDTQIGKAERAVAGKEPVKRNRFVKLTGGDKTINRELEAKARAVAGLKAYITNVVDPSPEFVIGAYHQLWHVEKSFRMSKHDLRARPIYHRKRDSIDAHLSVVFAALAITRLSSITDVAGGRTLNYAYELVPGTTSYRLVTTWMSSYALNSPNKNLNQVTAYGYDTSNRSRGSPDSADPPSKGIETCADSGMNGPLSSAGLLVPARWG